MVLTEFVKGPFLVRVIWGAILLWLGGNLPLLVNAAKPAAVPSPDLDGWKSTVRPFLSSHCISCHGSEKQKGGLNLEEYDGDILDLTKAGIWHEIVDVLNVGEMPPEEEPRPPAKELVKVVDWISGELKKAKLLMNSPLL